MRTVWRTQSGTSASRDLGGGATRLQHRLGHEALQVGKHEEVGVIPGRDRAELVEPVPDRRAQRRRRRVHPRRGCRTRPRREPSS